VAAIIMVATAGRIRAADLIIEDLVLMLMAVLMHFYER
jgi:hypothetical protein